MAVNALVAHVLLGPLDAGDITDVRVAALQGSVHGWMEGHLAAPGHREGPERPGQMPSPPFPDPADPDGSLHDILDQVVDAYEAHQVTAAFLHAVALGIRGGDQAGRTCNGCSIAHDAADRELNGANIRAGLGSFAYVPPGG